MSCRPASRTTPSRCSRCSRSTTTPARSSSKSEAGDVPQPPIRPPDGDGGDGGRVPQLEKELAVARERLEAVSAERDRLQGANTDLEQKLEQVNQALSAAQKDLG